jgi:hypothetical protein
MLARRTCLRTLAALERCAAQPHHLLPAEQPAASCGGTQFNAPTALQRPPALPACAPTHRQRALYSNAAAAAAEPREELGLTISDAAVQVGVLPHCPSCSTHCWLAAFGVGPCSVPVLWTEHKLNLCCVRRLHRGSNSCGGKRRA